MEVPLETHRLILNLHCADDFEPLAALWADPDVVKYIGGRASSRQDSWMRLLRYRGLWPLLGFGYWAIREKATGRFIGDIGFADFHRPVAPAIIGVPEAGWVLARSAHGQGFATEALHAALAWLDRETTHPRSVCLVDPAHHASVAVAQKGGFVPETIVSLNGAPASLMARPRPGGSSLRGQRLNPSA